MKTYNSPMLNVVSIKKNDIIVTSDFGSGKKNGSEACAPGFRDFEWYGE